ncbi:MAG: hypothetical protein AUJ75_04250 [Candidatus Omnitrophica bacterium CG1_02_49_10]|nr:MAG: hypothetical protein AUJ75_04250 [Candidatus Omnitrophica bacterium CG1_02_49_10]
MKAFFVGLIFLMAVGLFTLLGFLLTPLLVLMAFSLRVMIYLFLVLFAIWLLGRLIIFAWEKIRMI